MRIAATVHRCSPGLSIVASGAVALDPRRCLCRHGVVRIALARAIPAILTSAWMAATGALAAEPARVYVSVGSAGSTLPPGEQDCAADLGRKVERALADLRVSATILPAADPIEAQHAAMRAGGGEVYLALSCVLASGNAVRIAHRKTPVAGAGDAAPSMTTADLGRLILERMDAEEAKASARLAGLITKSLGRRFHVTLAEIREDDVQGHAPGAAVVLDMGHGGPTGTVARVVADAVREILGVPRPVDENADGARAGSPPTSGTSER